MGDFYKQETEAAKRAHEWRRAVYQVAERIGAKVDVVQDEFMIELPGGVSMPAFLSEVQDVAQAMGERAEFRSAAHRWLTQ
jgi:hypothetical protein